MSSGQVSSPSSNGTKPPICFVMKWTNEHDVVFCKDVLVSKLFETKKKSAERGQVWETIAKNLEALDHPSFRVDQRSVRDRLKKLLTHFRKQDRQERNASGISPKQSELDVLLEEINAREEASEALASGAGAQAKKKAEADKVAAEEMRKRAMEKLSETKKRGDNEQGGPKQKKRRGGDSAIEYLREKAERERGIKEEANRLEQERLVIERKKADTFFHQQNDMLAAMLEMQKQQSQQMEANQTMMMQLQQQQGQALMSLLAKLVEK